MAKKTFFILLKNLVKVFIVYLFFEIIWREPEMKNIPITSHIFMQHTFRRFLKFGFPTYIAVQVYFFLNRDKHGL